MNLTKVQYTARSAGEEGESRKDEDKLLRLQTQPNVAAAAVARLGSWIDFNIDFVLQLGTTTTSILSRLLFPDCVPAISRRGNEGNKRREDCSLFQPAPERKVGESRTRDTPLTRTPRRSRRDYSEAPNIRRMFPPWRALNRWQNEFVFIKRVRYKQ